jgi:Zn-dependent peptidase ImmA (M78 family)
MLENMGCVVSRGVVDAETEGACSQWGGEIPYVLVCGSEGPGRTRLDAAHELGHLVMHRHSDPELQSDCDKHRVLEHQAERFARALLMPARSFGREVWAPTVDALVALKKEWNCPVSAMITRCGEIGVFDADQMRRAHASLARRAGKPDDPQAYFGSAESPRVLARGICLLVDSGVCDRHSLLSDLSLHDTDIEQLAALPPRYFSEYAAPPPAAIRLRAEPLPSS